MSSLLSLVESRLTAEVEDITLLVSEQSLRSQAVADQVQQKWSAIDATFFAMQNVTGHLLCWSQVDNICDLVLLRPAECDHRAYILFGDYSFPSSTCARDPARGRGVCFTS